MALAGIDKEVGLSVGANTCLKERIGMLWHNSGIVETDDDLQTALEVLSLVDERRAGITLGIALWGIHIALAIHDLIPLPVDYRTSCHAHLEHIGVVGHQADGHESTEAPAMNSQALHVDIGQRAQEFDTLHLVFHLLLAQLAEGGLLEVAATILATTVVEDKEQIPLLRHVGLPAAAAVVPTGIDIVGVRTTIHIDHCGIFLCRVEVDRHYHAIVKVGHAVGSLDRAASVLGNLIVGPWVGGSEVAHWLAAIVANDSDVARHVGLLIVVDKPRAVATEHATVPALATLVDASALAGGNINAEQVALNGVNLVAGNNHSLASLVKAHKLHHHPVAAG